MFRITIGRLIFWLVFGAACYGGLQYLPAYFYAWEFDDFVRDEVKFAPTREGTDEVHLRQHIGDAAMFYGIQIDPKEIQVTMTEDPQQHFETIAVDVPYTLPVDLHFFTELVRRRVTASISY